ncbi:HipA domain-containing protein [Pseudoflavitalea sp. X16]|uniref:HipA domain-containing protein n=1 Tax=Paraflavitalea devenefica TaxID=2716334 RepID=UPI001422829C|nr:HipA domain-containing protein [Paraflavitalea devenefica]NII27435.1 HipA domain-containing protein [Paraflavitalea devenefica]
MMNCLGCYTESKEAYCLSCRKILFDKAKVSSLLAFDAPNINNRDLFQEHSKRMSISGVQLKYSLHREKTSLILCEKDGHYLLKPVPPIRTLLYVNDVPENEHLTMQMASQVFQINTAANALIYFRDKEPAYITRRFDVRNDGRKYQQEDFAQLTRRSKPTHGAAFKYNGTYEEIGLLIKQYVGAARAVLENFFKLIVFNYVISNGDAHLKNFSLIRRENGEYTLTPAYDLMSTVIHTPNESDTALGLYEGDMDAPFYATYGCYGRSSFMELANRFGIVEARALRIIDQFPAKEESMKTLINASFLSEEVKKLYINNVKEKLKRIIAA